jgi:RNA polymerase-binding transcription factor DksA
MKESKPKFQVSTVTYPRTSSTTRSILGTNNQGLLLGRSVNPKWAWHYRLMLGLRNRLLQEQREHLAQAAEPLEPHSMHLADSASDEFDHAMALSELSAEQDALIEIEEALRRIACGTYGVCEETGLPIPAQRLRAVPWTRFAKEAEARHEATGALSRPRLGRLGSVRGKVLGGLEESELEEEKQPPQPEDEARQEVANGRAADESVP